MKLDFAKSQSQFWIESLQVGLLKELNAHSDFFLITIEDRGWSSISCFFIKGYFKGVSALRRGQWLVYQIVCVQSILNAEGNSPHHAFKSKIFANLIQHFWTLWRGQFSKWSSGPQIIVFHCWSFGSSTYHAFISNLGWTGRLSKWPLKVEVG